MPPEIRDPRIDRGITWGLTTVAALAFSVGGWQFNAMAGEVKGLREDLSRISTRVAVVESAGVADRLRTLDKLSAQVEDMDRRLGHLEKTNEKNK